MPTKLYYFKSKKELLKWCKERGYDLKACEEAWIGPAYYYARSKKHISVHIPMLDKRRDKGKKKIGVGPWRHTHDFVEKVIRKLAKATKNGAKQRAKRLAEKAKEEAKKRKKKLARRPSTKSATEFLLYRASKRSKRVFDEETKRLADYLWENIPRKYKQGKNRVWTYIAVLTLAKQIVKHARERGVDPRSIDWLHEIDWQQGYSAAKQHVQQLLGSKEVSEKDVEEYLRWLERSERIPHFDQIDDWELRQMF